MSEVRVRVAALATARTGTLATLGLGSCVAIALWDRAARAAGLAHVLLPDPTLSRDGTNPAKFARTAVPALVDALRTAGAPGPYVAKLAGGASLFGELLRTSGINMGARNIEASREALATAGIPIIAEDVGGDFGRSVYLTPADGVVQVRSLARGDRVL